MPNPFSYVSYDLVPMTVIDSLPFAGVTWGQTQNQPGSWSGNLQLADPRVQAHNWQDATRTGRTALFVDLGGQLVWGGIILTSRYQEKDPGKTLKVSAMEFGSYFQQRLQAKDYTVPPGGGAYWNTAPADPMAIVEQLITDAQSTAITFPGITTGKIGGNGSGGTQNGITVVANGTTPAGNYITATYPSTQLQTLDSICQTLSQMGYTFGFDYSYDCQYLPGTTIPAITLNLWYPRKGRLAQQSGIVVAQRQVIDFTYTVDSTVQAVGIAETSSASGGLKPAKVNAPGLLAAGYPPLERVVPRTMINDLQHLIYCADGDLAVYANPVVSPTITVPLAMPQPGGGTDPTQIGFNGFTLGDDLLWKIDPYPQYPATGQGLNYTPRFPKGMNFEWRIVGWLCTPGDPGISTLTFTLAVPPSSDIPPVMAPL